MEKNRKYNICNRCIMDTSDENIEFDADNICNHCKSYYEKCQQSLFKGEEGEKRLLDIIDRIKKEGKGKKYDCIIGVSGGVDSTYIAYLCKHYGLRPLAVHLDNGWDSELAVKNIENTLKNLEIDLYTCVLDWEEFKDLQISFLEASTPGMEIPTDHAIMAILNKMARKYNIRFIINGSNLATEGIMPLAWSVMNGQKDWKHIKAVHNKFGSKRLRSYPHLSFFTMLYSKVVKRISTVNFLNYIDYDKQQAMDIIEKQFGWKYYGGKHYESIYTRFTQGYIQPLKFGFDKRRAHLSALICAEQLTRSDALKIMDTDPYPSQEMMQEDKEYFIKKLGFTGARFDEMMHAPIKKFYDYPSYEVSWFYKFVYKIALRLHFYLKNRNFYGKEVVQ